MSKSKLPGKAEIVGKYARHGTVGQPGVDTGSPEVQVAILTKRLEVLSAHSASHPNDVHSKRGLLTMVSKRKNLLGYLKQTNLASYKATIEAHGLRK